MNKVAITGIGIISTLGINTETVSNALYQGKSGIFLDPERSSLGFSSPLTGSIKGFNAKYLLNRKQLKTMPDFAVWAYAAVMEAIGLSGLDPVDLKNERTGIIFGCDSSCIAALEQVELLQKRGETALIGSGLVFRSMTSCITMNLNTLLGTKGACWTLSAACSSSGHAIGQAADLIALGRQDRVICGGAQEINWQSICSFDGLGAFSTRVTTPESASRPFDRNRDGLVPSGGAAAILLENWDMAVARGANILGELAGYGFSSDGSNLSVPSADGLARSMNGALTAASVTPGDVDYICAHATSTPAGDGVEAKNIATVFKDYRPITTSTKSMTGHELWMSGASQVVYSTLMARDGYIAPNINFEEPDEATSKLNIATETIHRPPRMVLCNAAGFGGTNSSLILRYT
ncbi:3-oxoacyl-[acyl-carrier-protein] synthase-1 [Desulfomicrobium norvegicum]|uniref:3-oxoacyl-[acyl-carrier-protein] synthase 1 n=1 Tax=Desulfomicrobium norvegicum (strain DSM 1741 / NCIMB 8310) TaxID=52561 RepID=A0A8G2C3P6_DESNO|nr:beta-ketoacyl-[acyl-carrier-protein] synthase family protein [Desulfomicrobium norvegicum]SFL84657.1 3-oxoacyl-[acyl-carrier-protein] synthase-1 [Desulfomicrobium norvegicum]